MTLLFAADFRAIGLITAAVVFIAFVALFLRNVFIARDELGSEVELAANRAAPMSDEELETTRLDRSLTFALGILTITAVVLPFYWLAEPGRQEGALEVEEETFVRRGENLYSGGAQCVNCHGGGGVGGVAAYVYQDADGQFLANASWTAPALNNVLQRYSKEEVTYVLNFGRPGSPMAAWGTPGGGPLTSQQIEYIIEYLETLQVQSLDALDIQEAGDELDFFDEESIAAQEAADELAADIRDEVQRSLEAGEFDSIGEAVFNLGLFSGYQAGSLSCGRCHTAGWSLGLSAVPSILDDGVAACGGGDPSGIGFSLCGGVKERFPDDTWKHPEGRWLDENRGEGVDYIVAMDRTEVPLDDRGNPLTGRTDGDGEPIEYTVLADGDIADCLFYSELWEPGGIPANAYPFDPRVGLQIAEEDQTEGVTDGFVDPPVLTVADLTGEFDGEVVALADGRLGAGCTVIDMPARTSQAHYEFIFNGADAGEGYGRGGLSGAGMMPGFGKLLPPDLIRAVVDYEREEIEQR